MRNKSTSLWVVASVQRHRTKVYLISLESRRVVVSYWNGDLPGNARLHFESFFAVNSSTEYHLYIENCSVDSTKQLTQYVSSGQLKVIDFEIREWLDRFLVPTIYVQSPFERLLSIPVHAFGWLTTRKRFSWLSRWAKKCFGSWFHSELGFTPPHNSRLSDYSSDLAYISDLFRCLAPSIYAEKDYWYFDLDVAFLKPLSAAPVPEGRSYVSQWGTSDFANSAIFHVSRSDSSLRNALLSEIQNGTLAKPWVIFSSDSCKLLGLHILPVDFTDPPWAANNPFSGDSGRFFSSPFLSQKELDQLEPFIFFHWHGMWNVTPQDRSPYTQLLSLSDSGSRS